MTPRLAVRNLTVELPTSEGWVRPVNDVSFDVQEGESVGIVGESGSGKTVLSLALMGLEPTGARRLGEAWLRTGIHNGATGAVDLLAASPKEMRAIRGREIAMIFQEPMTALNPMMRVGTQVEEMIRAHQPKIAKGELRRRAIDALKSASISDPERRAREYPHQLSGGLRQRVMIAMALAAGPGVLIADEPTTALDVTVQKQVLDLLAGLRRELHLSLLFITHDLGVIARIADRVLVMYAGRIVEEGATGEILRRPSHPYTQALLRAAPRLTPEKLAPIAGSVPALDSLPPGCAFAPRCPERVERCDEAVPELVDIERQKDGEASGGAHRARCILAGASRAEAGLRSR